MEEDWKLTLDLEDPRVPEAGPEPFAIVSAATLALFALALTVSTAARRRIIRFEHLPSLLVGSLVEADYQYSSSRWSLSGRLTG
jgi:hypothetical protein